MADTKVSNLAELTALAVDDELLVVDKSDTSMASSGTDKRTKFQMIQQAAAAAASGIVPTGVTYQNLPRWSSIAVTVALTSGTMKLTGIWLPAGFSVTTVSFVSGTTALTPGTSPHAWAALYDNSATPALLRQSTDNTGLTWAASTLKTFTLSSAYVTTYTGLHYLGLLIVAGGGGTQPTLTAANYGSSATQLGDMAPALSGNGDASLTTTAPNPCIAVPTGSGGATSQVYAGVA